MHFFLAWFVVSSLAVSYVFLSSQDLREIESHEYKALATVTKYSKEKNLVNLTDTINTAMSDQSVSKREFNSIMNEFGRSQVSTELNK